ncbi:hypothetical protein BGZ92_002184 [Podila epicladia]|nr:hypothetical protein BGZ92_002184 [Podila epicladia]
MSDKNLLSPHGTPPRQQQSTASTSSTASTLTSSASLNRLNINNNTSSTPSSSQQHHQLGTSPSSTTLPSSIKNAVPSTSRYNPPVPSRMTGTYSSNNSIYKGNFGSNNNSRLGANSAPSSPPGTPPNGLRNYYLNAASKRASHIYSSGSASNSTTTLQRPNISIMVPSSNSNTNTLTPPAARRSYSTGHLAIDEPEITVTTPGGSHSTEEHVMTLQKALSNLIEKELQGEDTRPRVSMEDEGDDDDTDGPILMKGSRTETKRSSIPGQSAGGNNGKGVSLTPRVLSSQKPDPEKAAATITHGISGSDFSLGGLEFSDKEQRLKEKKKSNRISRLFNRDSSGKLGQEPRYAMNDISRQPSKAGVLSNLLKLQGNVRHPKQYRFTPPGSKAQKEKKKRPKLYSRSANNSVTSLTTKSVFGTYPPLPVTPMGSATGMGTLTNTTSRNNTGNHRNSFQFDGGFGAFPAGHSPYASPNGSPRGSFSYDTTTLSPDSVMGTLSPEEKMRITFAVADILQRQDYVLRLARAMIKFGAPSHRLEDAVDHTARTLELNLQCVYLPNVMIVAFTDYETHTSETHLLKVSAGLDMYKFAQVHQILKMVTHSSMPVVEAIMKLDAINTEKDVIPRWANLLSYAVASFCTAPMFFKGGWVDAGVAFLLGGAVGLMTWLSEKVPSYAHICEITMSVVVAFISEALHNYVCRSSVKFAGIVMLLPGYTITCAILELSSRHMISGSVRLFFAIIFSLLLSYGLTIGSSLWLLIDPSSTPNTTGECPSTLDAKWNLLFVPLFAISLNVWLKAHPRQWILATLLSIVGYSVSFTTSRYAGAKPEVSSALASFAIGFFGNLYQRLSHELTFQAVVCAVFFLVPGSIGLKTGVALFTDDMAGGVNLALQMVISAIAISVGLFASALVVYPMGKSRSAQMTF